MKKSLSPMVIRKLSTRDGTNSGQGRPGIRVLPKEDIEFIINALRKESIKWRGRKLCLDRARKRVLVRKSKNGGKVWKYFWYCSVCEKWFRNVIEMEVDHIVEIGSFTGDWNEFLPRLFTTQDNLQCLCIGCHLIKTSLYSSARSKYRRKNGSNT